MRCSPSFAPAAICRISTLESSPLAAMVACSARNLSGVGSRARSLPPDLSCKGHRHRVPADIRADINDHPGIDGETTQNGGNDWFIRIRASQGNDQTEIAARHDLISVIHAHEHQSVSNR